MNANTTVFRHNPAQGRQAIARLRDAMEIRGERYIAVVDERCELQPDWLDVLAAPIAQSPEIGAATFGEEGLRLCADARCTLLSLRNYPAHLRIDPSFETLGGAVADFTLRGNGAGAFVIGVAADRRELPGPQEEERFRAAHGIAIADALREGNDAVARTLRAGVRRRPGLVSIVMLSWNAPQFTKLALESIRAHTAGEYEVIIVDNGSNAETVEWLRGLDGVRVIYNQQNRGYAGGNNQALEAARGEYVVLLNNDVVVTEGWLDGLLEAFDRVPALGISAPRSNRVAGHQLIPDAVYGDVAQMHAYAASRRAELRGQGYLTDRVIGLCLCLDRRLIDEIGGLDECYGAGNFEDDDFCLRARAAGYRIWVCDDVFIHHFGSRTFAANNVDWSATMHGNWLKFAQKWGYPPAYPEKGYQPGPAIARGFSRERHFVPVGAAARA